jgi:hypothetical protein
MLASVVMMPTALAPSWKGALPMRSPTRTWSPSRSRLSRTSDIDSFLTDDDLTREERAMHDAAILFKTRYQSSIEKSIVHKVFSPLPSESSSLQTQHSTTEATVELESSESPSAEASSLHDSGPSSSAEAEEAGVVFGPAPAGFEWGLLFSNDAPLATVEQEPSTDASVLDTSRPSSPSDVSDGWRGVHIVVSVDWEGSGFDDEDLAAFSAFRDDFPNIPLTHFLNAAYFTRLAPDDLIGAEHASDKIRTVLRDGDEIGLHVHADNHLLYASGVTPKRFPSWDNLPDMTGHSVPLSAFSEEEVQQVVAFSCHTLTQQGFDRPESFRAGGWHAGTSVFNALAAEGFTVDSSEIAYDWLPGSFGDVEDLWPNATRTSQPYRLPGGLLELPNNGCLADYVTSDQMVENFEAVARSADGKPVVLALGFHQETAAKFLPRLRSALEEIERRAATESIPVRYDCTTEVALAVV